MHGRHAGQGGQFAYASPRHSDADPLERVPVTVRQLSIRERREEGGAEGTGKLLAGATLAKRPEDHQAAFAPRLTGPPAVPSLACSSLHRFLPLRRSHRTLGREGTSPSQAAPCRRTAGWRSRSG